MKALAISGSARVNGNTENVLNICLEVLSDAGIPGELIRLAASPVRPCMSTSPSMKSQALARFAASITSASLASGRP